MNDHAALAEALDVVRGLAEDAVECGDGDCPDHDVPILAAVTLAAEIDRLRDEVQDRDEALVMTRAEIARLRKTEEAARAEWEVVEHETPHGGTPAYRPDLCRCGKFYCKVRASHAALRAALEEKP